jgi:4-hydroxythreonine-4-phosphate dehydrogenase
VPAALSTELLTGTILTTAEALALDFAIPSPRIAVAGLNPHAGEDGTIGTEERTIIAPAIAAMREEGVDVSGPYPADTLFHEGARQTYDAALCMYHDQALIPLKTIDFMGGVNITIGLPIVRTSPDHGTALDIAGTGRASEESLVEALLTAGVMARNRRLHDG